MHGRHYRQVQQAVGIRQSVVVGAALPSYRRERHAKCSSWLVLMISVKVERQRISESHKTICAQRKEIEGVECWGNQQRGTWLFLMI
jgi:hypothetical protein